MPVTDLLTQKMHPAAWPKVALSLVLTVLSLLVGPLNQAFAGVSCVRNATGSEICETQILFAGQPRAYKYEIRRASAGSPTVVEIPGGPGQGYVNGMDAVLAAGLIPKDYGVIAIDPRGVGVNDYGPDLKGGNYSSALETSDILEVIKAENLQNYLIHGQSYGTIVATKLGARLSSEHSLPLPRAIILSGVVNQFFPDQVLGYNEQMDRLVKEFSPVQRLAIQLQLKEILAGLFKGNQSMFAGALMNGLLFNIESKQSIFGVNTPDFKSFLEMLASNNIEQENAINQLVSGAAPQAGQQLYDFANVKRKNTMSEQVKCTEMSKLGERANIAFDIESLQFVALNSDCEKNGYSLSNGYFSKNYQIARIPLFYLQGNIDPATPEAGAKLHFQMQKNNNKLFVEIQGYAHLNMIGMSKCSEGLWQAMAAGIESARSFISRCNDPDLNLQN